MTTQLVNIRFSWADRRIRLRQTVLDAAGPQLVSRIRAFIRRLRRVTPVLTGYMKANWYWRRRGNRIMVSNRAMYAAIVIERHPELQVVWEAGP